MLRQHADRYSAQGIVPIDMVAWSSVTKRHDALVPEQTSKTPTVPN